MKRIAIIGAGLSGLILARELREYADVVVFEKSRGVGGRLATRRAAPWHFDHGAQFFTARSPEFRAVVEQWIASGDLDIWEADFVEIDGNRVCFGRRWTRAVPHYVAVPGMNALGKRLAAGLDIRLQTRVAAVEHEAGAWCLRDAANMSLGTADWVVTACPAPQSHALLPDCFIHRDALASKRMVSCFALMLGLAEAPAIPWQAALLRNADLSWISLSSAKPGRPEASAIVALATNCWSEAHMEDDREQVAEHLLGEVRKIVGHGLPEILHRDLHRWRYANIPTQRGERSLFDPGNRLAACGDWCVYGRVEGAFASAMDLAQRLRPMLRSID